jgi:hypothetical protein
MKTIRIGNGAGFLGDNLDAPRRLAESGSLHYLTLEYLAELTLSILARLRQKDPELGYASDFLNVLSSLQNVLRSQPKLRIITNAGGMNPIACARGAARLLCDAGLSSRSLGVVSGDDLLERIDAIRSSGETLANLDTGQPISQLRQPIVSANAYLGARPIVDALTQGADIVITGRVADASLTLGPAAFEFGWSWTDWDRLAGASVAGHLIECGAQATGGLFRDWQDLDLANVGYPIAEIDERVGCVITKPRGTGGRVDRRTIAEQLVYEIGDPSAYITPDVIVDFTSVELNEIGPDRVQVSGAVGKSATDFYKVSLAYQDGFFAAGQLLVAGRYCVDKARACAAIILARVKQAGFELDRVHVECLGAGDGIVSVQPAPRDLREVVLRVAVADQRREAVERFTKEFAPLITSGPPGLAGYAAGRPIVRPVYAYWPTLIPKDLVSPRVEVRSASDWLKD